jgi:hypothetical protein
MRVKVTAKMLVIDLILFKKGEKFQPEYLLKSRKLQGFHITLIEKRLLARTPLSRTLRPIWTSLGTITGLLPTLQSG